MKYTDNLVYTNTEIAIVTLTYPIDILTSTQRFHAMSLQCFSRRFLHLHQYRPLLLQHLLQLLLPCVVTMMVVAAVAEAASVAAPMVSAPQPHPNPKQYYFRIIPFWNSPPTPNKMSYSTRIGIQYKQKIILIRNQYNPHSYVRT